MAIVLSHPTCTWAQSGSNVFGTFWESASFICDCQWIFFTQILINDQALFKQVAVCPFEQREQWPFSISVRIASFSLVFGQASLNKSGIVAFIWNDWRHIIFHTLSTSPGEIFWLGNLFQREKHKRKQAQTNQEVPLALPVRVSAVDPPLESDVQH